MQKTISLIILFAIIGAVIGYFMFGKSGNKYIPIKSLIQSEQHALNQIFESLTGIGKARQKILYSIGVGALAGLLLGLGASAKYKE